MKIYLLPLLLLVGVAACETQSTRRSNDTFPRTSSENREPRPTEASARRTAGAEASMLSASMAYPTGNADTSALLVEKFVPREVQLGQSFTYKVVVSNLTAMVLENVVLTEKAGPGFGERSSRPAATLAAGSESWNLGQLEPRESRTIEITSKALAAGDLRSCASVSYSSALCTSIPVVQPALKLVAGGPSEISACDDLVYTYVVSNTGSGLARNVLVSGNFPEGVTDASGKRSFEKRIPSIAAGKSVDFALELKNASRGHLSHFALAQADGGLSARSQEIATVVSKPTLTIAMSGKQTQFAGRDLPYTIQVTNTGDGPAESTILEQTIPAGSSFRSASHGGRAMGGKVHWDLGILKPKESIEVTVRLATQAIASMSSNAVVGADCADDASAAVRTRVEGISAILLEVVDLEDPIEVGSNETYEVSVTNQGSAPDTNVQIVVTIPANTVLVGVTGASQPRPSAGPASRTVTLTPLAKLDPKAVAKWRITVKGVSAADARFKVSLSSDALTSPVEETEATHFYE